MKLSIWVALQENTFSRYGAAQKITPQPSVKSEIVFRNFMLCFVSQERGRSAQANKRWKSQK
jgi:hypothetical protein